MAAPTLTKRLGSGRWSSRPQWPKGSKAYCRDISARGHCEQKPAVRNVRLRQHLEHESSAHVSHAPGKQLHCLLCRAPVQSKQPLCKPAALCSQASLYTQPCRKHCYIFCLVARPQKQRGALMIAAPAIMAHARILPSRRQGPKDISMTNTQIYIHIYRYLYLHVYLYLYLCLIITTSHP